MLILDSTLGERKLAILACGLIMLMSKFRAVFTKSVPSDFLDMSS